MTDRTLGLGTFISIGDPTVTEIIAGMGFDWLMFDMEHGCMTQDELLHNLRAVRPFGVKVIVRIGEYSANLISRALDWGAYGIMMPHVSCAGEAEKVVDAMRYPPYGSKGYSSSCRAFDYGVSAPKDMKKHPHPFFIAQIENYEGVMNADEIAAVEGVDMLFVGPRDLTLDLEVRKQTHPVTYDEALVRVAEAAAAHDRQAGILVRNEKDLPTLKNIGYTALAAGSDMGAVRSGYRQILAPYGK